MTEVNQDLVEQALDEIEKVGRFYHDSVSSDQWLSQFEMGTFVAQCDAEGKYLETLQNIPVATNVILEIAELDTREDTKKQFIRTLLATKAIIENPECTVIDMTEDLSKWNDAQLKYAEESKD